MAHLNLNSIQAPLTVPLSVPLSLPRPEPDSFTGGRDMSQMVCAPISQSQHLIPQQVLYNNQPQNSHHYQPINIAAQYPNQVSCKYF